MINYCSPLMLLCLLACLLHGSPAQVLLAAVVVSPSEQYVKHIACTVHPLLIGTSVTLLVHACTHIGPAGRQSQRHEGQSHNGNHTGYSR
jgi:hypothetical protein